MKRIVITNSPKVESKFKGKADIKMMQGASAHQIFLEGQKVVENGGKLIMDPTSGNMKSYYKSLAFIANEGGGVDQQSLDMINKGVEATRGVEQGKEPVLAGIMQNGEINELKRILA